MRALTSSARPSTAGLLWSQTRYANRTFWREPVAAFFTLLFPLTFLVVLSAIVGNAVIDESTGLRFAQFVTPAFAVFGVCMASYVALPVAVAYARESGVLKRLRGTPVPPAIHIAGRIASAVWVSMIAVVVLVGVGVAFYGVQIVWRNVPALIVALLIGIACFAALGLAVASLAPTPAATQAITNGTLIVLAFVSGMFAFGELPSWVARVGDLFPLRHFVNAVADAFNPYLEGSVWAWDDLAIMLAWGICGALVALRSFRWEPQRGGGSGEAPAPAGPEEAAGAGVGGGADAAPPVAALSSAVRVGSAGLASVVAGQARHSMLQIIRDPMSMFFSMLFPVMLLAFFGSVYPGDATWDGLPLTQYLAAAFSVYGVAVMAYVNLAGAVAEQRAHLVLKRLRGTPTPPWTYFAGRLLAALVLGLATVAVVFLVGAALFGVSLPPAVWLPTLLAFVLSIMCFAALGLLLASAVRTPQTVIALSLATLLPLSFVSDIFISTTELPTVMNAIGWTFPLRHAVAAAVTSSSGGALDAGWWGHLAVVAAWGFVGALLTRVLFRWEPRTG